MRGEARGMSSSSVPSRLALVSTGISYWYFWNQTSLEVMSRTSSVAPETEFGKNFAISSSAPSFSLRPSHREHSCLLYKMSLKGSTGAPGPESLPEPSSTAYDASVTDTNPLAVIDSSEFPGFEPREAAFPLHSAARARRRAWAGSLTLARLQELPQVVSLKWMRDFIGRLRLRAAHRESMASLKTSAVGKSQWRHVMLTQSK
mmetsp:Transcript_11789/g.22433  ORF Transcript_11789/g.22433 Transcript_11789/m.22433 type:complete len:203 (-) Transcript_11789:32-640(-)